jgi:hypothetical protein
VRSTWKPSATSRCIAAFSHVAVLKKIRSTAREKGQRKNAPRKHPKKIKNHRRGQAVLPYVDWFSGGAVQSLPLEHDPRRVHPRLHHGYRCGSGCRGSGCVRREGRGGGGRHRQVAAC